MLYNLLAVVAVICIIGFIASIAAIRKQKNHEYDKGMDAVTRKHNVIANPGIWAYILFPVIIVVVSLLVIHYYGG